MVTQSQKREQRWQYAVGYVSAIADDETESAPRREAAVGALKLMAEAEDR